MGVSLSVNDLSEREILYVTRQFGQYGR